MALRTGLFEGSCPHNFSWIILRAVVTEPTLKRLRLLTEVLFSVSHMIKGDAPVGLLRIQLELRMIGAEAVILGLMARLASLTTNCFEIAMCPMMLDVALGATCSLIELRIGCA